MISSRKRHLLVFITSAVFLSCSDLGIEVKSISDPDFQIPLNKSVEEARRLIIGEWDWGKTVVESRQGMATYTPQTEGYTRRMAFLSNGMLKAYRNDSLVYETSFRIDTTAYLGYLQLALTSYGTFYDFRVNEQYFSHDERPVDGALEFFVRRR